MNEVEFVNLEERARTAISLGESHFREFKSVFHGAPGQKQVRDSKSVCKDISEALVAFGNADGGELLVGVEDDGEITGLETASESYVALLESAPTTHVHHKTPLPPVKRASLSLDGRRVLYFSVQKSTSFVHLTSDGRCVQRRDLETVPIPPEEIIFSRKERESRGYDRQFLDDATAGDLNTEQLKTVADQLSPGMSMEKCLQYLDLAEFVGPGLRLRRAAPLLFGKEPSRWHPRLQIRIIKVAGNELLSGAQYNAKSDQTVTGNILELIERGWDSLRPQLVQTRLGRGARFESTMMYPELACREALVNAIAHRDYAEEGRGIEIFVFDDRMEVRNPGALLSSVSMDDLLKLEGVHQSRNAICCRVLRELGYMRELGEGMRRMFDLMRVNELTPPELGSAGNSFSVTLRHTTIYNQQQLLWLQQFDEFSLDREQKAIVVLGIGGALVSPQDIWDNLGIVDTEHYRQLVRSLQDLGILTSQIPKDQAQRQARRKRISVRKIARFRISVPKKAEATTSVEQPRKSVTGTRDAAEDAPDPDAKLWIGNLDFEVTEEALVEFLSNYATVENVYMPKGLGGRPKGYAFVEFSDSVAAIDVMARANGELCGHRRLVVRRATPRVARATRW